MCARVRVIITGKIPWSWLFGNKVLESERDFGNFLISRYMVLGKLQVETSTRDLQNVIL